VAAFNANELSEQDLLHSFMAEYLDGELPEALRAKFDDLLKKPGQAQLPEHFQAMRGRLQLSLQSYYLKEGEVQELRSFVQDPTVKATAENVRIDELGRGEIVGTILRRLALVAVAAGLVGLAVWKFATPKAATFKALEYLGYEALAMEEDPRDRLDLPSHEMKEIRQYLTAYPGLEFKPKPIAKLPEDWRPDGATIIDYEIAKVSVVQYSHTGTKEKMFHFSYAGELSDLPKSDPGNIKGLVYQAYASDELNLVAWQQAPGLVSILAGRRSGLELAEFAADGK